MTSIFDRYAVLRPSLVNWLRARGVDYHGAEDVANEAFLRCLRAEQRGQTVTSNYLYSAARSVLVDWTRQAALRPAVPLDGQDCAGSDSEDPTLLTLAAVVRERFGWIAGRRRLIVMLLAMGLTHREIGERCGVTRETVSRNMASIRRQARRQGAA